MINISAETSSGALSAKIANAFTTAYLDFQRGQKISAARETNSLLDEHLQQLKQTVFEAESAAEEFREKNGLASPSNAGSTGHGQTVAGQQLAELNSQLSAASSLRVEKEASLRQLGVLLKEGHLERAPEVLRSPLIERLSEQEAAAAAREAALESKYGPESSVLLPTRAELRKVHQLINEEMLKIGEGLAAELIAAKTREAALRTKLEDLKTVLNVEGNAFVRLDELQTEATAALSVYRDVIAQEKRTATEADMQRPDAELISAAEPPLDPSYPRPGLTLMLTTAASAILGLFLALTRERHQANFRSSEEFEAATSLRVLGLVPDNRSLGRASNKGSREDIQAREAIAGISFRLQHRELSPSGRVVMVTSAVPKEGKTHVAIALAQSFARQGARVLLIDCDLRKPTVASEMNLSGPGLNALAEQPLAELLKSREPPHSGVPAGGIVQTIADGLDVLPSFTGVREPLRFLSSAAMEALIDHARANYDTIILDTPPVLAVTDAGIVSRFADTVILVTNWHKTPRVVVANAIRILKDYKVAIAGAVLNRVNIKRYTSGDFGSHSYVYKNCHSYYAKDSTPALPFSET